MNEDFFILFSDCILVSGHTRSTLCDLTRGRLRFIPNEIANLLRECRINKVDDVKRQYNSELDAGIDLWLREFAEEDWGFWTGSPDFFPPLSTIWDAPALITNAIVDFDGVPPYDFEQLAKDLRKLGCKHIELRIFSETEEVALERYIQVLVEAGFHYIEILAKSATLAASPGLAEEMLIRFLPLFKLTLHSAPFSDIKSLSKNKEKKLILTTAYITSESHCGVVSPAYFSINLNFYAEGKNHNTCLNRKIGIDKEGIIKNCPSMKKSFGKFPATRLDSIVRESEFSATWNITKDQVSECSVCEFRVICPDCRAITAGDIYSKPAKCNYQPLTGIWSDT